MDDEIAANLDLVFKKSNNDYQKFLSSVASYLKEKTGFYSSDYQQIIKSAFDNENDDIDDTNVSEIIPLQKARSDAGAQTDKIVPETELSNTSGDLFDDENETQFDATSLVSNSDNEIIPDTQFNESDRSDVTDFLNEKYVPAVVAIDENSKATATDENEHQNDLDIDAQSDDFLQVAPSTQMDAEMVGPLESQVMVDHSFLANFEPNESTSLSSTRIEQSIEKNNVNETVQKKQNEKGELSSGTSTPDINFDNDADSSKFVQNDNIQTQMETDDLFNICTQPVPKNVAQKSTEPATATEFAKPTLPVSSAKNNKTTEQISETELFEMATQPVKQPSISTVRTAPLRGNDNDLNEMASSDVSNDDIYEAATQLQSHTIDIFDAPTQRIQIRNRSNSPERQPSGKPVNRRLIALDSQFTQPPQTPDWSVAKQIPSEKAKEPEKIVSQKRNALRAKQKWLFGGSSDEEDNNDGDDDDNNDDVDDDLEFDLTPPPQQETARRSLMKSNGGETSKMDKIASVLKTKETNKPLAPIKESLPAKRTRSLSIVLSRREVFEHLNEKSVSPKDRSIKNETDIKEKSPKTDAKNSTKTDTKKSSKTYTSKSSKIETRKSERTKSPSRRRASVDIKKNDSKPDKLMTTVSEGSRRGRKRKSPEDAETSSVQPKNRKNENDDTKNNNEKETSGTGRQLRATTLENPSHSLNSTSSSSPSTLRCHFDRARQRQSLKHPVNILFTKGNPTAYTKKIKDLGGFIVDTPQLGSILICDSVSRTFKFLYAICKGIPIVSSKWLDASHKFGSFIPVDPFILIDEKAEKRFHFNLKQSSEMARQIKLFANYHILATPSAMPTPSEIAEIVQCGGGEFSFNPMVQVKTGKKTVVLITDKSDQKLWKSYKQIYPSMDIVSSEGFMQSVMKQKIAFSSYLLR